MEELAADAPAPPCGGSERSYDTIFTQFFHTNLYSNAQTFLHVTSNGTAAFATDGIYRDTPHCGVT